MKGAKKTLITGNLVVILMQKTVLGLGGDTCFEFQIILSYCLVFPSFCSVISAAAYAMNTFSCNEFVI